MKNQSATPRLPLWRKIALTALFAAVAAPAWPVSAGQAGDTMTEVLDLLSSQHVSGVTEEELSGSAIKAMIESLDDPYTQYMSSQEWEQFMNSLTRSYVGIGVQISKYQDAIYIERVFADSPAAKGGLEKGDVILKVDGQDVAGESSDELVARILGKENTSVTVTVKRGEQVLDKALVRKAVSIPVLDSACFDGGVGYLKLYSFSDDADELFKARLDEMKATGDLRSLVVDLRDNPGGLLGSAGNIASQFIKDSVLIHTKTRDGKDEPVRIVGGSTLDIPVYVLVNENSASASEVLAGALQDYGAAVIVGAKTYGKGSVQNVFSLSDGSMLKITIEQYFTPKGHAVNDVGITPDMEIEGDLNQLLTVLRLAGADQLALQKERSFLTVNGLQVSDMLPAYEENGRVWIHSRTLAAMAGAEVAWLPETGGVELTAAGTGAKFVYSPQDGNAILLEGMLFIDADAFARQFPQVSVSRSGTGKLELQAERGN